VLASGTNVGTYADNLASATGTGLANYAISFVNGSLTITPAPLTITADDARRAVGAPNPAFTASYAGFVGGETPANLGGTLAFATPAVPASPPGAYAITPSGQTSSNYRISFVDGVLLVDGARPPEPPRADGAGFLPQAVAATYTDAQFVAPQVPTVQYLEGSTEDGAAAPAASRIRVLSGGLNLGR
jgi:hypothetical protein